MRRMGFALVILTTAALATPAASAEPVPPIDCAISSTRWPTPISRSARRRVRSLSENASDETGTGT